MFSGIDHWGGHCPSEYWLALRCSLFHLWTFTEVSPSIQHHLNCFYPVDIMLNLFFIFLMHFSVLYNTSQRVVTQVIMQMTNWIIEFRWISRLCCTHWSPILSFIKEGGLCAWKHLTIDFPREVHNTVDKKAGEMKTNGRVIPKKKKEKPQQDLCFKTSLL